MAQLPPVLPGAPPAEPLPAIITPTTYRELMSDVTRDAVAANPGAYLAGYRFSDAAGGAIPVPATLRDQTILLCDRQPMAFMCLVPRPDGVPEVRILHRLMRYLDLPGEQPTGYHDRVLALLGDVRPMQYPVVEVPGTAFHLAGVAGGVRVPTAQAMDGIMADWVVDDQNIGPFLEDDDDTIMVRPRHIQLLPTRYAALLVHRDGLSPKSAYVELAGAIQADGNTVACADVLTWLRAAFTARGGGAQPNDSIVLHPIPPVHLPQLVYLYVTTKVAGDLPALRAREPGGEALTAHLARTLLAAGGGGPAFRDEGETGEKGPKTVREAFKETFPLLLRFNRVDQVEEVAPIWARLANSHKSEHQIILQQEFAKVCTARDLAPELHCPVVTTKLKQMVLSFNFTGAGPDDLASGLNPFLVTYAGAKDYYQAQEAATVTYQLDQGNQNASFADIQAIKANEKVRFPSDLHQAGITLQRFAVLSQTLLQGTNGVPHPFVKNLWTFANGFLNRLPFILDRFHGLAGSPAQINYPSRVLRTVQILTYEYLQTVTAAFAGFAEVDNAPDFASILTDLQRGTYHTSNAWISLPTEYLTTPSTPLPLVILAGSLSSTTAASTGATPSVVSGLTSAAPPTATTRGAAAASAATTRVINTVPDAVFQTLTLRPRLGDLLRVHRPPQNDAGVEFCVSWWCKGACYSNCGRNRSHVPFASPGERERLLQHVTAHLVATD